MKIAITGHTRGIGRAIDVAAFTAGHDTMGFSRRNGYDIPHDMDRIIDEASDCDVFVNNVNCGFTQVDFLYRMHATWLKQDKRIINISSRAGTYPLRGRPDEYALQKHTLDTASAQLTGMNDKRPRIINIKPGFVDTDAVATSLEPKLDPKVVADAVMWILNQPPVVHISELSLSHMKYG